MITLSHTHTHTATLSLLLCEKPQPLNEPQICPVNWCSHTQTDTNAQKHTGANTHILTNAIVTRPSLHSQGERKHQTHTHSLHFHRPQSTVCVCERELFVCI